MSPSKQAMGLAFAYVPQLAVLTRSRLTVRSIGHSLKFRVGRWSMCSDISDAAKAKIFMPSPFHKYRVARSRRASCQSSESNGLENENPSAGHDALSGAQEGGVTEISAGAKAENKEKRKSKNEIDVKKGKTRKKAANKKTKPTGLEEVQLKEAGIENGMHFASHEDLMKALEQLKDDPLQSEGGRIVTYRGSTTAKLMIIGEAPGEMEDKLGQPFVGRAGELLDKIFHYGGFDIETQIYVTNVVKRRPRKNRTPNTAEMQYYKPFLLEEIRLIQPAIIVLAGAVAAQAMLGPVSITKVRGKWYGGGKQPRVMPVFHPAYLLRNPIRKHDMVTDIEEIRDKYMQEVPYDTLSPLKGNT
ncbi:Uracil DNA glycosylase [Gracilaria domingensis]|nr:Uracil DNA glycosylase [Gracilaria domingensis]